MKKDYRKPLVSWVYLQLSAPFCGTGNTEEGNGNGGFGFGGGNGESPDDHDPEADAFRRNIWDVND